MHRRKSSPNFVLVAGKKILVGPEAVRYEPASDPDIKAGLKRIVERELYKPELPLREKPQYEYQEE